MLKSYVCFVFAINSRTKIKFSRKYLPFKSYINKLHHNSLKYFTNPAKTPQNPKKSRFYHTRAFLNLSQTFHNPSITLHCSRKVPTAHQNPLQPLKNYQTPPERSTTSAKPSATSKGFTTSTKNTLFYQNP